MTEPYHSALNVEIDSVSRERFVDQDLLAFRHDLFAMTPAHGCDVVYCEPPWPAGIPVFDQRAGVVNRRTPTQFYAALGWVIRGATRAVIVSGKSARRLLPDRATEIDTTLRGAAAVAYCYGWAPHRQHETSESLIHELAETMNSVYDPCCGYGRTGKIFVEHGKRAVLSDYNPKCIGYIAQHSDAWPRNTHKAGQ